MIEIIFKEKIKVTTTGLENIFKVCTSIRNDSRYYASAIKDD